MALKIVTHTKYEKFDIDKVVEKLGPSNKTLGIYAAASWHRLYFPFVPMQTGILAQSVIVKPFSITHTAPYAARQYHGNFNFSNNPHPLATMEWDVAATRAGKATVLSENIQAFINSGKAGI